MSLEHLAFTDQKLVLPRQLAAQVYSEYPDFADGVAMPITSILDACQFILDDQGEPQSSYWLASQIVEMRLWRASEADVRDAVIKDIAEYDDDSRFIRVGKDEFGLRTWVGEQGIREFMPTVDIEQEFLSVAKWVRSQDGLRSAYRILLVLS